MKLVERLAAHAADGAHGRGWYDAARTWAHAYVGADAPKFLNLLAATSPRSTIRANVRYALRALARIRACLPVGSGYGVPVNAANVARVSIGGVPLGPKVEVFARALAGCPDAVPVDSWMVRAAGYNENMPTERQRARIVKATNVVARRLGWTPAQAQAAIWTSVRAANGGDRHGPDTYAAALG